MDWLINKFFNGSGLIMTNNVQREASASSGDWLSILLRGITAIIFGVVTWSIPHLSLLSLLILVGVFCFSDGILAVWAAFTQQISNQSRWALVLDGLVGLGVGLLAFAAPAFTTKVFLLMLALWAVVNGVSQIVRAIEIRKQIHNEWLLIFAGLLSIILGIVLFLQPGPAVLALLWLIASFAIVYGLLLVLLALKTRKYYTTNSP